LPSQFQTALALCCVLAVEGCFAWLIYGFATSFSSGIKRSVSLAGIVFLFVTMAVNIVTHYQMAKRIELNEFQRGWIEWGGVAVVVAVLAIVLLIELGNPESRLRRLELRVSGIEREAVLPGPARGAGSRDGARCDRGARRDRGRAPGASDQRRAGASRERISAVAGRVRRCGKNDAPAMRSHSHAADRGEWSPALNRSSTVPLQSTAGVAIPREASQPVSVAIPRGAAQPLKMAIPREAYQPVNVAIPQVAIPQKRDSNRANGKLKLVESSAGARKSWTIPTTPSGEALRIRRSDAGFVVSLRFRDQSDVLREPYLCYLTADEWRAAKDVSLAQFVSRISEKVRRRKAAAGLVELIGRLESSSIPIPERKNRND
jgi:hypothetical protein